MDKPQLHDVGNGYDPGLRLWTGPLPPVDTLLPIHLTLTCRGRHHHPQKGKIAFHPNQQSLLYYGNTLQIE